MFGNLHSKCYSTKRFKRFIMFSIGKLSKRTNVKVVTIRYYEKMGLMTEPDRNEGNQRVYDREALERLSFIKHARDLGLSIEIIRELIVLNETPDMPCEEAHKIANAHLEEIEKRIAHLKTLKKELMRITTHCHADHIGACYVIKSLSDHGMCGSEHD